MAQLILRPNLLGYPGTNPGFDSSHPATQSLARNVGFSAVAAGTSGMWDLYNANNSCTLTGSGLAAPVATIRAGLGPAVDFSQNANAVQYFPSQNWPATVNTLTSAIIFTFSSVSGTQWILEIPSNHFTISLSSGKIDATDGTRVYHTFTPVINIPYFFAISCSVGFGANAVLINLATGQLQTIATGTTFGLSGGTRGWLGNNDGGSLNFKGAMAAAMTSMAFLTMPQLIQWSQDPWAFWYPQKFDLGKMLKATVAATAAGGAFSVIQDSAQGSIEMIGY